MKRQTLGVANLNKKREEAEQAYDTIIGIIMTSQLLCLIKDMGLTLEELQERSAKIDQEKVLEMLFYHSSKNDNPEGFEEFEGYVRGMLRNADLSIPIGVLKSIAKEEEV
jgi:hypothetical protein